MIKNVETVSSDLTAATAAKKRKEADTNVHYSHRRKEEHLHCQEVGRNGDDFSATLEMDDPDDYDKRRTLRVEIKFVSE